MAQFDVYVNPQLGSRGQVPYVLDVQSDLLDALPSRLVLPLMTTGAAPKNVPRNLCPSIEVGGATFVLMPQLAAPVAAKLLRKTVVSVRSRASDISAAMDAVLSGF